MLLLIFQIFVANSSFAETKNPKTSYHKEISVLKKTKTTPLKEVEQKLKSIKTLETDYEQIQKNVTSGALKKTFGKIFLSRPNLFSWKSINSETKKEESLLISNGQKVWFYTFPQSAEEAGQVLVRSTSQTQTKLVIDLITGQANLEKDFKISTLGNFSYKLSPKTPLGDIDTIELHVENTTKLVYKLVLFTLLGNQTEIIFKNHVLNPKLNKDFFEFKIPKGTEEIR